MATTQDTFKDVHSLPHAPEYPNSVRWADDGTLAVSTGNCITLLHPGRFGGAISLATADGERQNVASSAPGKPAYGQDNIHFDLNYSTRILTTASKERQSISSMAWSPMGCSSTGTCLLAAVTEDHQVLVYGPPADSLSTEWTCLATPMEDLLVRLKDSNWEEVDDAEEVALSLRGGARVSTTDNLVQSTSDDKAGGELNSGAALVTKSKPTVGDGRQKGEQRQGGSRRKPTAPQQAPTGDAIDNSKALCGGAIPEPPLPELRFNEETSNPRPSKVIAALGVVRHFFAMRRQFPPEDLPVYEAMGNHLKGTDLELFQRAMDRIWGAHRVALETDPTMSPKIYNNECRLQLRYSWDRRNNVIRKGFEFLGAPGGLSVSALDVGDEEGEEEEEENVGGRSRLMRRRGKRGAGGVRGLQEAVEEEEGYDDAVGEMSPLSLPVVSREPYIVPHGFHWRELPPVDPADRATLRNTLVKGAVRRFLRLRAQERKSSLHVYEWASQHLKGLDLWLLERVYSEYWAAHTPALEALSYTRKSFSQAVIIKLRHVWNRATNKCIDTFSIESDDGMQHAEGEGDAPPVPISNEEPPRKRGPRMRTRGGISSPPMKDPSMGLAAAIDPVNHSEDEDDDAGGGGLTGRKRPHQMSSAAVLENKRARKPPGRKGASTTGVANKSGQQKSFGGTLTSEAYQRRLLSVSALSVAWSPAVPGPAGVESQRCCYLAVGTKAGRVWIWRYTLPPPPNYLSEKSPPPEGGGREHSEAKNVSSESTRSRLVSLGGLPGKYSWATVMAWSEIPLPGDLRATDESGTAAQRSLALAVGSSDGGVYLWAATASSLAAIDPKALIGNTGIHRQQSHPSPPLMTKLPPPLLPDLRPVTSLDACLRQLQQQEGASQLVLAIGKTIGEVVVWGSMPFCPRTKDTQSSHAESDHGRIFRPLEMGTLASPSPEDMGVVGLGTQSVTGIVCCAGGELVVAALRDGTLVAWAVPNTAGIEETDTATNGRGRLKLVPCAPPVPCSRRRPKDAGFGAYGVSASPGRLFVAVVRLSLPAGIQFVKQLQVHQKVTQGVVQLYRLAGPGAAVAEALIGAGVCAQAWVARKLPPAALWDTVQLVGMSRGWVGDSALAGGCKDLVEALEASFFAFKQEQNAQLPSDIGIEEAWRSLQAAVTLRGAAAPPPSPSPPPLAHTLNAASASGQQPTQFPEDEWTTVLYADEFLLLQRRLQVLLLQKEEVEEGSMSRLLAADCVMANVHHPMLFNGLVDLASRVYAEYGEEETMTATTLATSTVESRAGPQRPVAELDAGVTAAVQGGGMPKALSAALYDHGEPAKATLPRCPASLEVCVKGRMWACRLCSRPYQRVPVDEKDGIVQCILCAGLVGLARPDFLIFPPCM